MVLRETGLVGVSLLFTASRCIGYDLTIKWWLRGGLSGWSVAAWRVGFSS